MDTIDWQKPLTGRSIERVMTKIHPWRDDFMHPTEPTAQALEQLINKLKVVI